MWIFRPLSLVPRLVILLLAGTALLAPVFAQAATVGAVVTSGLGSCGQPGPATSSSGGGVAFATNEHSQGGCFGYANAVAGAGYLSTSAISSFDTGDWSSGNFRATASAGFSERVRVGSLPETVPGIIFITIRANASGSVSFSRGSTIGSGVATNSYSLSAGAVTFGGTQTASSSGDSQSGDWGNLIDEIGVVPGSSYLLSMSASSATAVGKLFEPGRRAVVSSAADFGNTLKWLGVVSMRAVDDLGNPYELPEDFRLELIGETSGFDYWNSAPTPVPLPMTLPLLLSGLAGLALMRRRADRG